MGNKWTSNKGWERRQLSHCSLPCLVNNSTPHPLILFVIAIVVFLPSNFLLSTLKNLVNSLKYLVGLSAFSGVNTKPCLTFLCLLNYSESCVQLLMQFRISVPSCKHWFGQCTLCPIYGAADDSWSCWSIVKGGKGWFRKCQSNLSWCCLIPRETPGPEENVEGQWPKCHYIYHNSNYLQNILVFFSH